MTLLEKSVVSWWSQLALALPVVVGLFSGCFAGVLLFVGDRGPPGVEFWAYTTSALFLLSIPTFFALKRWLEVGLSIVEIDGERIFELDDHRNTRVVANPGIRFGWNSVEGANGVQMTELCVVVYDEDEPVVLLKETWGAVYGTPKGWPTPFEPHASCAQYGPSGRSFLTELVDLLVPETL